jgi:hypothetical protein
MDLGIARRLLDGGSRIATFCGDVERDYRAHLCRWEDDLFEHYPVGHGMMVEEEAVHLIRHVFVDVDRPVPQLEMIEEFSGFADVERNRIFIERGCLYRFLVLHECAHLLIPGDLRHGPAFTYVVQGLYRAFLRIPEQAMVRFLRRHDLPCYTAIPA